MNNASDISPILGDIWQVFSLLWWVILPISFFFIFKVLWIDYTLCYSKNSWRGKQKWVVLEIIPPREIEKGPQMMENIFTAMSGVLTTYDTFSEYLKGAWHHDRFSVELVGENGTLHFYMRIQKQLRNYMEAHIYAQYPGAEIIEVPDYTQNFPRVIPSKDWDLWGTDFEFVGKDPIPIKTYDKFEESVTGEMIDPISAIAEVMGSLGPGQHIWLQYVLQPLPEPIKKKYDDVVKKLKGEKVVEPMGVGGHLADVFVNIFKGMMGPIDFAVSEKNELAPLEFRLSPMEKEILKATEENLGKNLFQTKMRFIYIAKRENWDGAFKGAFIGALKQFNDINYNQVKPEDISKTYGKIFRTEPRASFRKRKLYGRYKSRNMDGTNLVFSTKELATLYHFPDIGVKSPAIRQVQSKFGSAPANLPVE